jgi:hypothetical protein
VLQARGFRVLPVFRPAFAGDGIARQLFDGGPSLAQRLSLSESCDLVLLGHLRTVREPQNLSGLVLSEVALDLRAISPATGTVEDELQIRQKGGGLNPTASLDDAVRKLGIEVGQRVQRWPG